MTAFGVIGEARQLGLTLWAKENGNIGFKPERLCSPDLREKLRAHKPQLLPLLQTKGITWTQVFSDCIGETIFFCENEDTKEILIEAGAEPWNIYTRDELQVLVAQNRIKPLTQAELRKVHHIKRTFGASLSDTRWIRW